LLTIISLTGRYAEFIHTPLLPLLYVISSGIMAMAVGDSIYIKSLSILDASIAFPIAQCSFVVLTVIVAVFIMGEPFTWLNGVGAGLVVLGIYLIAAMGNSKEKPSGERSVTRRGVILTLVAAIMWTAATITLKIGVKDMDAFVAAGFRISTSAILLSFITFPRGKKGILQFKENGLRSIILAATAGILTYGVAAVGYVKAIQMIGAGRTVLLTTTAPLFVLPFSIFILKEKPTLYAIAGIFICVGGIYLVVV